MRTTASVLTVLALLLGACTVLADEYTVSEEQRFVFDLDIEGPAGWEMWVPVTVLDDYPASGDLELTIDTSGVDFVYADAVIVDPEQGDTVDVYFNSDPILKNNLMLVCVYWDGKSTCSTGYIEAPPATTTVRVESNADYLLSVRGWVSLPAPYVTFLPAVGR